MQLSSSRASVLLHQVMLCTNTPKNSTHIKTLHPKTTAPLLLACMIVFGTAFSRPSFCTASSNKLCSWGVHTKRGRFKARACRSDSSSKVDAKSNYLLICYVTLCYVTLCSVALSSQASLGVASTLSQPVAHGVGCSCVGMFCHTKRHCESHTSHCTLHGQLVQGELAACLQLCMAQ